MDKSYESDVFSIVKEIQYLIYPNETHMDFNISTALKLESQLNVKVNQKEIHMLNGNYF